LEHFYKWDNFRGFTRAGKEKGGRGWIKSVEMAREDIKALLKRYPSLKNRLPVEIESAWAEAVKNIKKWLIKIDENPHRYKFPLKCPYTYEEAMTRDLRRELEK
ncbi:MAG: DUF29 family protein, partial [Aquificaceae bacterium]